MRYEKKPGGTGSVTNKNRHCASLSGDVQPVTGGMRRHLCFLSARAVQISRVLPKAACACFCVCALLLACLCFLHSAKKNSKRFGPAAAAAARALHYDISVPFFICSVSETTCSNSGQKRDYNTHRERNNTRSCYCSHLAWTPNTLGCGCDAGISSRRDVRLTPGGHRRQARS